MEERCLSCDKRDCACERLIQLLALRLSLQGGGLARTSLRDFGFAPRLDLLKLIAVRGKVAWAYKKWDQNDTFFSVVIKEDGVAISTVEDQVLDFRSSPSKLIWQGGFSLWQHVVEMVWDRVVSPRLRGERRTTLEVGGEKEVECIAQGSVPRFEGGNSAVLPTQPMIPEFLPRGPALAPLQSGASPFAPPPPSFMLPPISPFGFPSSIPAPLTFYGGGNPSAFGGLTLPQLAELAKRSNSALGEKRSKEDWFAELRGLTSGEWLKELLPLHKFLAERGGSEKKLKLGAEVVVALKRKRREVLSWGDWMVANDAVARLGCPNEEMRADYLAYITRGLKLQDEGVEWANFARYDKAYRNLRKENVAKWTEVFAELVTFLVPVFSIPKEGKPMGFSSSPSPHSGRSPTNKNLCFQFNSAEGCKFGENCIFIHKCGICGAGDHARNQCKNRGSSSDGRTGMQ